MGTFDAAGVKVFAISYDSLEVLSAFAKKYGITYPLISDEGSMIIREFGILNTLIDPSETEHYGLPYPGTYLVDTDGRVTARFFNREYQVRETAATLLKSGFDFPVDSQNTVYQEGRSNNITVSAMLTANELRPRQTADLYVTIQLPVGVHVYGQPIVDGFVPTTVEVSGTDGLIFGEPHFPPTRSLRITGLTEDFQVFKDNVEIRVPVTSTIREEGVAQIEVAVRYQACTASECFIPTRQEFQMEITTGASRQPASD